MIDWIGRTLGRVQVKSLLARGGMAEVYLGTHTTLHRDVAVKILRHSYVDDPRLLERFELEARAVAKLRHPNIVQVFDFDTVEDQPYLVMEYVSGPSLSQYLSAMHARNGRLELPLINRLLNGVANALQYAHESGVIHRDVKPGNILLTSRSLKIIPGETMPLDFEPVLTDFGLVRFLDSARQTTIGQTAGTPAYMSPEQAMGFTTDGRTDIYSLGIVLYEMLSGKVPFDGETTMSVLLKHLNEAPAPVPGLSPALQDVLDRALAKNADDRFQEPKEFAAAFNAALTQSSDARTLVSIPRPADARKEKPPVPAPRQRSWMPAILAGALIALVSASLLFTRMLPAGAADTPTPAPQSATPVSSVPLTLGPTGVLRFQDGNAILDRAILVSQAMPAPPPNSHYQAWLVNDTDRLPLGVLQVDGGGRGELTFDAPRDMNLLATYSGVQITIEPRAGSDPDGLGDLAYAYTLPEDGLLYLRRLMVSFTGAPEQVGLIQGLATDAELLDAAARAMLRDYESGDVAGVRENAEAAMNILVGEQSPDHKDWNHDGQITDPGDGYGFLLNGDKLGYIQAIYSHADYAINSAGASRNIIVNGEDVQACAQNLASWAPDLREQLRIILEAKSLSEMDPAVQRAADLANRILNGVDVNENGVVDPVTEDCGVLVAREYAYHMADMPLLPVNALNTPIALTEMPTPTPTSTSSAPAVRTPTKRQNESQPTATSGNAFPTANNQPGPTNEPQPTNEPKPTKEPQPTREPQPTKEPKPTNDPPGNPNQPGNVDPPGNSGSAADAQPTKKNP
jgi:serine/threonine protein kinase